MATYQYGCTECGHVFDRMFKIADRKTPESEPCPSCGLNTIEQQLTSVPFGDPVRLGIIRPNSGMKEVLSKIHEKTAGSQLHNNSQLTRM